MSVELIEVLKFRKEQKENKSIEDVLPVKEEVVSKEEKNMNPIEYARHLTNLANSVYGVEFAPNMRSTVGSAFDNDSEHTLDLYFNGEKYLVYKYNAAHGKVIPSSACRIFSK